jgi:hypothetical protein|tara:strand:- start:4423 stop:4551 length:129 start_codon:yes stop_codon:yes gene_type:complete
MCESAVLGYGIQKKPELLIRVKNNLQGRELKAFNVFLKKSPT